METNSSIGSTIETLAARLNIELISDAAFDFESGGSRLIDVRLHNSGDSTLYWSPESPITISYRWLRPDDNEVLVNDGLRTELGFFLAPGERRGFTMRVVAPEIAGRAILRISCVLEGHFWFYERYPTGWFDIGTTLVGVVTWPENLRSSRAAKALRGALSAEKLRQHIGLASFGHSSTIRDRATAAATESQAPDHVASFGNQSPTQRDREAFHDHLPPQPLQSNPTPDEQPRPLPEFDIKGDEQTLVSNKWKRFARTALRALDWLAAVTPSGRAIERVYQQNADLRASLDQLTDQVERQIGIVEQVNQLRFTWAEAAFRETLRGIRHLSEQVAHLREWQAAFHAQSVDSLSAIGMRLDQSYARLVELEFDNTVKFGQVRSDLHQFDRALCLTRDEVGQLLLSQRSIASDVGSTRMVVETLPALGDRIRSVSRDLDLLRDANVISTEQMTTRLNQLQKELSGELPARLEELATRTQAGISGKIDHLLWRQIFSAPAQNLIFCRNAWGLFGIPESDIDAVTYYSAGVAPEPATLQLVEALLSSGKTFVDVGANIGLFTVAAARKIGPTGKVFSIEPDRKTAEALTTNIRVNGVAEIVDFHLCAAGRRAEQRDLYLGRTSGHNSLAPLPNVDGKIPTEVKTLDQIIGQNSVDLIKIDVEGWELEVLAGATNLIKNNPSVCFIIEFGPSHLVRMGQSAQHWFDTIGQFGFKIYEIDEDCGTVRPMRSSGLENIVSLNLLLAKRLPSNVRAG